MTPRERWLALLDGETPDRVPTDIWATGEVFERLMKELGCPDTDAVYDRLAIDGVTRIGVHSEQSNPLDPEGDLWGVRMRRVNYGAGDYWEVDTHPLADVTTVEQVHAYPWPDPDACDWEDFRRRARQVGRKRIVQCGAYEPFLLYCSMRGMEQAMMDLLAEPEIAEAILDHIFDFHYRLNGRMWELAGGAVDMTYLAEDLGSQTGLLMGLEPIRRFLLPRQKKMADLARSHGIHIFYHTDGSARQVIPDLLDVTGIEILNPIQWRCPGMEREGLVRDFGDRVVFHGAVDNQQTLPFGSPEDVRREVLDNLRIFAPPARYICAPCHNIQPNTPTGNILAMYETLGKYGRL
jgi:uroporphyrinogen decarboxylase